MYMPFIATIRSRDGTIVTRHFVTRTKFARARAEALLDPGDELLNIETNDQPGFGVAEPRQMDWDALARANAEAAS